MAYIALYRAYRPQKFSEVVGQQHIIKTLQNAIKLDKVAHAYLFCGPRGTGKTTLAKILAKAMNCEHGPAIEPCCECDICKGIAKGTISDVVEIDAASNNGADDIRALRDTVNFLPAEGRYKIYIIDEVHMLSNAAFNALLKTLEEPPKHVIFILATTEPYKLPNTILSRCQRFDFQSISTDDIVKRINIVVGEENIKISDEAIYQIAASAEGGMRDALSLLDQAISYSTNEQIELDDILAISGNTSYLKIIELLSYCIGKSDSDAILLVDKILKEGKEVPRLLNDIILFLKDVLIYKNNAIIEEKLMYKNDKFIKLSSELTKNVIYRWLDILNDALNNSRYSVQKRAFLEIAIIKMNDVNLNEDAKLVDRVTSLERNFDMITRQRIYQAEPRKPEAKYEPNIPSQEEMKKMLDDKMREANETPKEPEVNIPEVIDKVAEKAQEEFIPEPVDEAQAQEIFEEKEPQVAKAPEVETPVAQEAPAPSSDISSVEDLLYEGIPDNEITVKDIEKILNNASKEKREALTRIWDEISEKYVNVFVVQMLVRGKIIAVSDHAFIVELKDVGFCNRLMRYENYVKILEIFDEYNLAINDYICLPQAIWNQIKVDYMSKYKDNPKPELKPIRTGVLKREIPSVIKKEEKSVEEMLEDYFNKDEIKIVEE